MMRVFCDSCEHTHTILPDIIISYSSYGLLFILHLWGQYFAGRLCWSSSIPTNLQVSQTQQWQGKDMAWFYIPTNLQVSQTLIASSFQICLFYIPTNLQVSQTIYRVAQGTSSFYIPTNLQVSQTCTLSE